MSDAKSSDRRLDRGTWLRGVGAVIAGILMAMAFPPFGFGFLAPVSVALLTGCTVSARRLRGSAGLGFIAGLAFFGILLRWMAVLGSDAWIALAVFCALWFALVAVLTKVLHPLPYWPLWVAGAWVTMETLRDRYPWGGFPWGRLAFSQADSPTLGLASLGGAPLITFAVAFSGTLLTWFALTLLRRRASTNTAPDPAPNPAPVSSGVAPMLTWSVLGLAVFVWVMGSVVPRPSDGQTIDGPASATVALVQGSVPNSGLDAMSQRRAVLNNHVAATLELADKVKAGALAQPELVIWPENSSDLDPFADEGAAASIRGAADAIGAPILVGAVVRNPQSAGTPQDPTTLWNVGIVWEPGDGPSDFYIKRHPVPFGEYLPGRSILSQFITRFERIPFDFVPGPEPGVLQVGPARIADVICFEIAYDEVVRDAVVAGGRAIAVQTNNATYSFDGVGGSAQPEQQAAMSSIRAVEHGRAVMIAATSGVTAFISPDGSVTEQAPLLESTSLVAQVPLRDTQTLATRLGAVPEWLVVILTAAAVVASIVLARRARADTEPGQGIDPSKNG